ARPKAHVISIGLLFHSKKNDRVSVLGFADVLRPKNFHEIARLRLREIGKVAAKCQLLKEPRRAGAVRIPAPPDALAVALSVANHQFVERRVIELERAASA